MVSRRAPVAVVVVAPARAIGPLRTMVAELGSPFARSTIVEMLHGSAAAIVAEARGATPSRGVVVVVGSDTEVDTQIASGVDEVLVEPIEPRALLGAIRRATLRAGVRDDHAVEARTLEQVLDGVAHAAEGPLAALALDLDAIRSGTVPLESVEELESALDDCSSAVDSVARVLRDAQVLARATHDDPCELVSVAPLVDRVLRALGGASALLAHVEVHSDPDVPNVHVPRRLLGRTIAQVLVQALDAVPAEPPPSLRRLRVSVRNGPEAVAVVIDVHASLDAAPASTPFTVTTEGRLAVARAAMRSFDGELVAERAVDGSVRFVAFIPRADMSPDAPLSRPAHRPSELAIPRARVLVVDGDPMVLRATVRAIADRFDVVVAISGEEALSVIRDGGIDAVVADARLPDMSAAAFLDELRRMNVRIAQRVVWACRTQEEAAAFGRRALERPIRRAPLLAIIDEMLAPGTAPTSPTSRSRILN